MGWKVFRNKGNWCEADLASGAGRSPPPTGGSGGACGGVWSPRPTGATLVVPSSGPMYLRRGFRRPNFVPKFGASVIGIGPYALRGTRDGVRHAGSSCPTGGCGESPRLPGPAAHSGASAARMGGTGWNRSRGHPPKCSSTSDNPSVTAAPCQLPLHKGAFPCGGRGDRTGDADCRVASLLAMTVLIIPRRPNGPTWESVLFYDGRGFGPPYERRGERHAEVVGPYGKERKPNQPPKPAGAQRSVRARGCEGWAGIDARTIPKGGPPLRVPRQRSERGKSSWSNSVFARQVSCSARGTGFGGFSKAPPVLALTLPQLSRTV